MNKQIFIRICIIFFFIKSIYCGDGIGDATDKIQKTTTPLIRPQKIGYFFNVHEIEPMESIMNTANDAGYMSQADRMEEKFNNYIGSVYTERNEAKDERFVRDHLASLRNAVGSINPTMSEGELQAQLFRYYQKALGSKGGMNGMSNAQEYAEFNAVLYSFYSFRLMMFWLMMSMLGVVEIVKAVVRIFLLRKKLKLLLMMMMRKTIVLKKIKKKKLLTK